MKNARNHDGSIGAAAGSASGPRTARRAHGHGCYLANLIRMALAYDTLPRDIRLQVRTTNVGAGSLTHVAGLYDTLPLSELEQDFRRSCLISSVEARDEAIRVRKQSMAKPRAT